MARVTTEQLEACRVFAAASVAVADVVTEVVHELPDDATRRLLAELEASRHRLRALFTDGHDGEVSCLALSTLVLSDRTVRAPELGSS
jgi:hypothetical protein